MRNADHEEILEQIPAYALGVLDNEEAEVVERHLGDCSACRSELVTYQEVVDYLPLAAPEGAPSPDLRNRMLHRVRETEKQDRSVPAPRPSLGQRILGGFQRLTSAPRWQLAASIVIIALVASNLILWLVLGSSGSSSSSWRRVRLAGTEAAPEATGIIYISEDGRNGTLIVDKLPGLEPDQQYQLWLIKDGQRASGAVFSVDPDGYRGVEIESFEPLNIFTAFGITVEPTGGSPGPTGQRVLSSDLE